MNDVLDGVLEGSDDEAQSDAIVNQVLDEIGIEIRGDLNKLSTVKDSNVNPKSTISDKDIDRMLAELK